MARVTISEAEKIFILHGIQDNIRVDGRRRDDIRPIVIETDIVTHASGSARIRLANTDILVGVKAELSEPKPNHPDEGRLEFFVDCSANATPEFEGRGGEEIATQISRCLSRSYGHPSVLDLRRLGVLSGHQCWVLYVDILILECGGNLLDAVSIAVKSALYATTIPKVKAVAVDGGVPELELSDDPSDGFRLDVSRTPVLVTLTRIGNFCAVDATPDEEACSSASVVMAVAENGKISSVTQIGSGTFQPDTLNDALVIGKEVGIQINKELLVKLKEEKPGSKKMGFLD